MVSINIQASCRGLIGGLGRGQVLVYQSEIKIWRDETPRKEFIWEYAKLQFRICMLQWTIGTSRRAGAKGKLLRKKSSYNCGKTKTIG